MTKNYSIILDETDEDITIIEGLALAKTRRGEDVVLVGYFGELHHVMRLDDRKTPEVGPDGLTNARPKLIVPKDPSKLPFHVLTEAAPDDQSSLVFFNVPREGKVQPATTGTALPQLIAQGTSGKGAFREYLVDMALGAEVFVAVNRQRHYIFTATATGIESRRV